MANYTIPTNPVYNATIRKLEDSDPASASTIFNPLIQQLIENTHAVKKSVDELKMFVLAISFSASMKGMPFTVTGTGMTTYNGTVPDSLAAAVAVPSANTTYTVKCAGKSKAITTGSYYGVYYGYVDTISTTLAENSWAQIAAVPRRETLKIIGRSETSLILSLTAKRSPSRFTALITTI